MNRMEAGNFRYASEVIYPPSERTLNKENVEKASASMGGDVVTTKLFWGKF